MNEHNRRNRDQSADTPLKPFDPPLDAKKRELEGSRAPEDQSSVIDASDTDNLGTITQSDIYEGELEAGVEADLLDDAENLELLTELELRAEETDDPHEAAEEGFTYVPPIDPPTRVSINSQDVEVASGFGVSALDEPYDADHPSTGLPGEDDMSARVRDALRADSATSGYADRIGVFSRGGVIVLRGVVDDLDDTDDLVAVASYVEGVVEVIDETEVRSLMRPDDDQKGEDEQENEAGT